MGVPAFFRWLSKKYPSIVVDAVEEKQKDAHGVKVPVDATQKNPNFQEFDNLYLDMNGIIHPCTHPEDRPAPKTEDEMFILIFEYIDRLFSIVRPRRVLYMAIDGVAPRAKMNQQRSRRFRAAKEALEKKEEILSVRRKLASEGVPLPPPKKDEEHFDSNCITPGTPFMDRLAIALRYYVHMRITTDPAWQSIQVILSDANVPGEGEHKIMDYIRRQRASPSHDPNTVHCLCGADADLIMLGLATHEANFNILREEFVPNQPRACELCGQYGHELKDCKGLAQSEKGQDQADPLKKEKNFIFIRLPVLREYLERELAMPNLPFEYDFERAIDDWVFMCFFVGNDFLPHLPSLEIRENAIDRLIKLYKNVVYSTKGWLTKSGDVYLDRVEQIMVELGKVEDEIFKTRQIKELRYRQSRKNGGWNNTDTRRSGGWNTVETTRKRPAVDERTAEMQRCEEASARLKAILLPAGSKRPAPSAIDSPDQSEPPAKSFKEIATSQPVSKANNSKNNDEEEDDDEPHDGIRLWERGWKERYYQAKFGMSESDADFRHKVAWAYVEGLCWVLKYYYQGCVSWNWYFPYHYAPFASDFDTISQFKPDFSKPTAPFKPLEQLMGVFPAASRAHIPETWRWLMTDEESPISDFYPKDFEIDLNGKKYAWQGVALLPFVDEHRLLDALKLVYPKLTADEQRRNDKGPDRLFVGKQHPLFSSLLEVYNMGKTETDEWKENANSLRKWAIVDHSAANGMSGEVSWDKDAVAPEERYESLFKNSLEFNDIRKNTCIMVVYRDPQFPDGYIFDACRLEGAEELERVLKPGDYNARRSGDFKPQIGFSRDVPQARLSSAGQRILNHAINYQNGMPLQPLSAGSSTPLHPLSASGGHRPYYNSNSPYNRPPYHAANISNNAWRHANAQQPYLPMHDGGPPSMHRSLGYHHTPSTAQGYGNRPMPYGNHYSDPPRPPRPYHTPTDRHHHQQQRQPPYHQHQQQYHQAGGSGSHYQQHHSHHYQSQQPHNQGGHGSSHSHHNQRQYGQNGK